MDTCKQIKALLPSFVDGAAGPEAARISAHLETCGACRQSADAQVTARGVLRARAAQLMVAAPPGLHTRVAARIREVATDDARLLGWRGRLTAFGAAALVVIVLGSVALPTLTLHSTVLLAAQLALDHVKCFVIDGDADGATITTAQAEATLKADYGWTFTVPDTSTTSMRLVAVRKCLYGHGFAAHLLYVLDGELVSLFVMPGLERPADALRVFDHDEVVWNDGGKTFMLVARSGAMVRLQDVASRLRNEAR